MFFSFLGSALPLYTALFVCADYVEKTCCALPYTAMRLLFCLYIQSLVQFHLMQKVEILH